MWLIQLAGWEANQLVFIDDSAVNEHSAHRKYGWAPIGITPHIYAPIKRSERWSILPAYTLDGFLVWEIIQGSYVTESFNEFIENKVLPIYNPYPGPRSIIVMDNAPIHHLNVYFISHISFNVVGAPSDVQ